MPFCCTDTEEACSNRRKFDSDCRVWGFASVYSTVEGMAVHHTVRSTSREAVMLGPANMSMTPLRLFPPLQLVRLGTWSVLAGAFCSSDLVAGRSLPIVGVGMRCVNSTSLEIR